ncbi:MAG TPA: Maf family protein [Thermoanaerobaculia bacterium]|jgi:septum formation protein|nr:Maf family protein [Thermoanaerobaculia bacterium]
MPQRPGIVLASASPRRAEILASLGIPFAIRPADVPEVPIPGETAESAAARLAGDKAARAAERDPDAWVLAADTLVFLEGRILGKPREDADARGMLRLLAGREHSVVTAVRLRRGADPGHGIAEVSRVRFSPMTEEEIAWYAATGEPRDKAGAYGVQGLGARFIQEIHGSFTNVMGLPARGVYELIRACPDPAVSSLALSSG